MSDSAVRFHTDEEDSASVVFHDEDEDEANDGNLEILPKSQWVTVKSAFADSGDSGSLLGRDVSRHVSTASSVVSMGTSAVSHGAKALTVLGVGAAAAVTAGTAGVALGVAGLAFTGISIAKDAVSLGKTLDHIDGLEEIQTQQSGNDCRHLGGGSQNPATDHACIQDKVLPYILRQKKQKAVKKAMGAAGLGTLTGVARVARGAYKSATGAKGVKREFYAYVLARHTITCECGLARKIVSELYSPQEYLVIRQLDSDAAGERLARKMKSV